MAFPGNLTTGDKRFNDSRDGFICPYSHNDWFLPYLYHGIPGFDIIFFDLGHPAVDPPPYARRTFVEAG